MKYFSSQTWSGLNAIDPQARESAFERADRAWDQYYGYLESIRSKISARRWRTILQCHGLHDCVIESISVSYRSRGRRTVADVRFVMENRTVLFKDVTRFSFQIDNQTAFPCGSYCWDYCEFELLDTGRMTISILGDVTNQIDLEFESIECGKRHKD